LAAGHNLGPYEIVEPIGRGGMGAVYRARDTRLGRDVAIKVGTEGFGERFGREARVISSLNHPNICHLYDVGENFLVMELIKGQTLADRLKQGPVPLKDALRFARQMTAAIAAAHEAGIIHRDLKPGNVIVRDDGSVKVLDFGIAKVVQTSVDDKEAAPTMSMTQEGAILGTPAYMAPEQARGKSVDKRADIWAFGVILYEMITGVTPFAGDDHSDTLAAVMKADPDLRKVPATLRPLLDKCLQKDPHNRLRDISGVDLLLDLNRTERARIGWLWPTVAATAIVVALAIAIVHFSETPTPGPVIRFNLSGLGNVSSVANYLALSPDGRQLIYTASDSDGVNRLWIRSLSTLDERVIPGTEGATGPFWSPDSQSIAFAVNNQLKRVDASGSAPPITIATVTGFALGMGSWKGDVILLGTRDDVGPILKVPSAGGTATPVTRIDRERGESFHGFPSFLPDGRHFLYLRSSRSGFEEWVGTYIGLLDDAPDAPLSKRLVTTRQQTWFVPSSSSGPHAPKGHLLYLVAGTLMAQPFDPDALVITGEAVPVGENVGVSNSYAQFTASAQAVLAYRKGGRTDLGQLSWRDRRGNLTGEIGPQAPWGIVSLSPAADRLAAVRLDGSADIWMTDLKRGVFTRLTFEQGLEDYPVWSPDGSQIAYSRQSGNSILVRASDGSGEPRPLLEADSPVFPMDWSPDGRALLYETSSTDIMVLPLEADGTAKGKGLPFVATRFGEAQASFSPDGRWVVYVSAETGETEVFVRPFTMPAGSGSFITPGAKWQISDGGGWQPRWNKNGREILYLTTAGMMVAVAVDGSTGTFQAQTPKPLFPVDLVGGTTRIVYKPRWDLSPDGERFLINWSARGEEGITVVLNWEKALDR
jgi:eukaryotic-like serine/threonine-protein kinase